MGDRLLNLEWMEHETGRQPVGGQNVAAASGAPWATSRRRAPVVPSVA